MRDDFDGSGAERQQCLVTDTISYNNLSSVTAVGPSILRR